MGREKTTAKTRWFSNIYSVWNGALIDVLVNIGCYGHQLYPMGSRTSCMVRISTSATISFCNIHLAFPLNWQCWSILCRRWIEGDDGPPYTQLWRQTRKWRGPTSRLLVCFCVCTQPKSTSLVQEASVLIGSTVIGCINQWRIHAKVGHRLSNKCWSVIHRGYWSCGILFLILTAQWHILLCSETHLTTPAHCWSLVPARDSTDPSIL